MSKENAVGGSKPQGPKAQSFRTQNTAGLGTVKLLPPCCETGWYLESQVQKMRYVRFLNHPGVTQHESRRLDVSKGFIFVLNFPSFLINTPNPDNRINDWIASPGQGRLAKIQ